MLSVSLLFLSANILSIALPVHFSTCLSQQLAFYCDYPAFSFRLTLHFTHVSLFVCSCLSSVPVRWNISALLMIQQSFLYLSIHLFLIVKPLSRADSRQAWFPFNSKAEGELFSLHSLPALL